ncbi:hypothetical protein J6590_074758 [Homalodisca vitripennis]|nr:hypothetical protein J6590_074758 [Homalodisca vitripennis]
MSHRVVLWGGCANTHLECLQSKKAVRTFAKLEWRESCRPAFRNMKLLTLSCLYILKTCLFFRSKYILIRGRDNYRTVRHRTVVHERLPSQAGAQFVNKLPNVIKSAAMPKAFKTRLKTALISEAFYKDEFTAHFWLGATRAEEDVEHPLKRIIEEGRGYNTIQYQTDQYSQCLKSESECVKALIMAYLWPQRLTRKLQYSLYEEKSSLSSLLREDILVVELSRVYTGVGNQ